MQDPATPPDTLGLTAVLRGTASTYERLKKLPTSGLVHLDPRVPAPGPAPQRILPLPDLSPATAKALGRQEGIATGVVDYPPRLGQAQVEPFLQALAPRILALFPDGRIRRYEGDNASRLVYNAAYLRSMYAHLPSLAGARVLEVGCSDRLASDLVASEGVAQVDAIDAMPYGPSPFDGPRIRHHTMDAHAMAFPDASFDLVFSIATFEHCRDPRKVLEEILRVLVPGGCAYIQAGPLFFSPFGHHMFGFFDDQPWIHLRRTPEGIAAHARSRGLDAAIQAQKRQPSESWIRGMLDPRHINGLALRDYGLEAFGNRPEVEVQRYQPSFEGRDLLTPAIREELRNHSEEDLVGHGFEFHFRKRPSCAPQGHP